MIRVGGLISIRRYAILLIALLSLTLIPGFESGQPTMIAKTRIDYDASSPAELPMPGRLSYTIDEAASATGLTRRKIQGACARGELVWSKIGNTIVIPASSLRRLVKEIS